MKNLIIRPQGIGDIVLMIPALRSLTENNPEEEFTLLCYKGFSQILPPELKVNVIEFPNHAGALDTLKLLKQIRNCKFDRVFDLYCNPRTALITFLSGIKQRHGFDYRFRSFAYNNKFDSSLRSGHFHQTVLYCKFFESFGLKCESCEPRLKMPENVIAKAKAAIPVEFANVKPFIAINPNPSPIFPTRSWPEENIIKFIELWYAKTNSPVMLTWGPGEEAASKSIIEKVGKNKAFMHSPLKLNEFAALLSQLDLFISGDCGPMHIAWATGVPIVALFGPTPHEDVYPLGDQNTTITAKGIDCLRCYKKHCPTRKCMYAITPETVLDICSQKLFNH